MVLDKADGEQSTPKWLWLHSSVKVSRRLRNPLPVDWELALYIGFGCLLVIGVYRARAMQQRRENLRHTSGSLHIDGTCRDSQISSTAVRHICTRVAFMVEVVTTRGSAEEGGFAMQNYTMLGCCAGNFDCCLRISTPMGLLEEALQVLCTGRASSKGQDIVGFSVCHWEPLLNLLVYGAGCFWRWHRPCRRVQGVMDPVHIAES